MRHVTAAANLHRRDRPTPQRAVPSGQDAALSFDSFSPWGVSGIVPYLRCPHRLAITMRIRLHRLLPSLILALAAVWSAGTNAATMRALLVGVSEYPSLDQNFQLEGPRNDIARMRDILSRRGFQATNMTVLADGVPSAELPTRANILDALDRLAKTATKEDTVLLYFAGHGSQQPADRTTEEGRAETDGLFEIFLPRDIGHWSGARGSVENALIKTELRAAVDRIRATGAFVWGVFDACHSATLVRGANPDVRMRYVNPMQLGVPQTVLDHAAREGSRMRGGPAPASLKPGSPALAGTGDGGSVFFYAAQTRETTPEMRLPVGHAEGRQYGLFGYMLMEALETGTPMTYRQMAQYVLARYGAMNETRVTPLFSGTALDQPVLGQQVPVVRQWALEAGAPLTVRAGALAGLIKGATLAVMADPLAPTDKALGYIRLTDVSLAMARAEPVTYRGKPALQLATLPKGTYARAVQSLPDYALRVSVDGRDCQQTACAGSATVKRLRGMPDAVPGTVLTWVDAPAQGDVLLKLRPDRIVLLPPSLHGTSCDTGTDGNGTCPQSATLLATADTKASLERRLATSLHAVARATNLLRLAARLSETGDATSRLEVSLRRASTEGTVDVAPEQVPTLRPGDRLAVAMRNTGLTPVDVTMLYLDARYGINTLFPDGAGASNRLEPNASHAFEIEITDDTLGMERLLTIAVDAGRGQERADFSFLAQPSLAQTRGATPGNEAAANDDVMAFMDAGFAAYRTRAARPAPQAPSARTSMRVYTFQIAR